MKNRSFTSIWLVWFLATFFYAYQYVLRVLPNIMMTDILEKFHIDASLFGQYSGFYYIGYALMHIPIGILLDHYGPKWVLPFCILLTVLGLSPLLYADHWIYPTVGRVLIGMGSSAAILGVFKIIRMSFAEEKFTFILGCSVTVGLLGAIYGGGPVNYLMQTMGSQNVLKIIILMGIGLAITTFFSLPAQQVDHSLSHWKKNIKEVLMNPRILMICLFAGCMVGPLEGFADVWGKEYLKSVYQLEDTVAASLPSLIFLGMCLGSPLLSWLLSKTQAYFCFLILSGLIMGGGFLLLLSTQLPVSVLTILFIIIGLFCAYQILAIYKATTYSTEGSIGLTTASANMIIMIFGYVFHSLIGQMMTWQWDGKLNAGVPVYEPSTYTNALCVIPIGLFIGAIGYAALAFGLYRPKIMSPI